MKRTRPGRLTRRQAIAALGALALPWEQLFAAKPVTADRPPLTDLPPDLVNLHDVMQWIAGERSSRLSFLDPQWRELDAWKGAARPFFRDALRYHPKPLPLAAELVRREERDGVTLEALEIHATPAYRIPARVLIPKGRRGRLPAVVGLHCHSGRFIWGHEKLVSSPDDSVELVEMRNGAYGRPWAEALARRGYVVAVIDAFYFGARRLRVEEISPQRVVAEAHEAIKALQKAPRGSAEWVAAINQGCKFYEPLMAKNFFAAGATWPGLHVWDDMRTIDYLISRPDVDPNRIGCAGMSIGGLRAAHLIGADPRVKAASITGWMTQFAHQHRNHLKNHTWQVYVPGLYAAMDLPDVAGLHAPGALLVQQCRQDRLYPPAAMQGAVDQLARIYDKAGLRERFRGTFYDEPHCFKPHMQDETFAWFDRWL